MQSWEYKDCQIIDYTAFLDDVLVTRKFTKQFNSEIHDRTILECEGFSLNPTQIEPESIPEKPIDYVDFVPDDGDRAQDLFSHCQAVNSQSPNPTIHLQNLCLFLMKRSSRTPSSHQLSSVDSL